MTVTTNTIGSNSAEIIAYNETNLYTGVMTAVDSFVRSHGWTAKSGVGNALEKVYTSANAAGAGTKEIKINAIDLHIEHADSFTGTTTVTSTNRANRVPRMDHVTYPDYLYANVSSVTTTSITPLPQDTGDYTDNSISFSIAAAQTTPLYPGQWIKLIDRDDTTWWWTAIVQSHDNTTGAVTVREVASNRTGTYTFDTGFSICVDRLNYVDDTEPAHIFISATSKHIAIQCRNTNGSWHDFHAVIECENPLAVEDASILTTGYMLGNSGYTVYGVNRLYSQSGSSSSLSFFSTSYVGQSYLENKNGKSFFLTGPFSMPSTRRNFTGLGGSVHNEISTALGSAKIIGLIPQYTISNIYYASTTSPISAYAGMYLVQEGVTYFRGMGDVIPATYEPVSGKLWALTGTAICDKLNYLPIDEDWGYSSDYGSTEYSFMYSNTNYFSTGTRDYRSTNYLQQTSSSTEEPTLLGRIYNVKFLSTGIYPSSIVSVKVDGNGFADNNGVATDHLVFAVKSTYTSNVQNNGAAIASWFDDEGVAAEQRIRQSESVAIGFPK